MAWLSTASVSIVESKKYITEWLSVVFGTQSVWYRTRTVVVTRYPGLTQAAAETKASTDSAAENVTDAHTEATGGGSYAAVTTTDVKGTWTKLEE